MKFTINIESSTQPGLVFQLEQALKQIKSGRCYLHQSNTYGDVQMHPDDQSSESTLRLLYDKSHPKPVTGWIE